MFDQDCGTAVHVERGLNVHSLRRYFKLSKRDLFVIPVICVVNKYILKCPGNCVQGVVLRPLQSRRRDRHDSLHGQRVLSLSPSSSSSSSLENLNGSMVSHRWRFSSTFARSLSTQCGLQVEFHFDAGDGDGDGDGHIVFVMILLS